ncbi:hypothetical protein STIV2_C211 [Sulfolobus turreted icosahedral virus 2]|uniref:Uncharacterized protein n=1 Tax=Sulfolobus turreted icosahedral virus 2 TaxID=754004 RepID=D5IEY8_9VIRU|nr:hypothetical protein STIV2_C211 [Sulfolobus turreted icosahedral virus 2]ADF27760.1 hypothetical protein STIV2_C211 [Sulfolobus turreted icosahedral virus 2]
MKDIIRLGERLVKELSEIAFANNILREGEPDLKSTIAFLVEKYIQSQKDLVKKNSISLKEIKNKYENARCTQCQKPIKLGEICYYDPESHKVLCARCFIRNNAESLYTKEIVQAELKLNKLKDEIRVLEKEKKEILGQMKMINIYEELDNKAKVISEKVDELKKFLMDYIKIVNPNEEQKQLLREKLDEMVAIEKEVADSFKLLAKAVLKK